MPPDSPSVSVIVLNYNSLEHLAHCLGSLMALDYPSDRFEVLLVDNASSDGSPEWVAQHFPSVRILYNEANLGFAAGNTAGAQNARGDWVAFLNPDTRVEPDWLSQLVQPALRDPEVVCVASKMLSWDGTTIDFADAAINFMGWGCQPGFGSHHLNEFAWDKELIFACGGAMLIRRQIFLEAGGFDSDFYAYYEDVDLGWRLWLMGYKIAFASRAVVYHRHHGSWNAVSSPQRWVLAERNTLFTLIKNYDDSSLARALPASILLLGQRVYLDVRPDPRLFGDFTAAPAHRTFGPRYYFEQARRLLQRGAYRELARRVVDEVERRRRRHASRAFESKQAWARSLNGTFEAPAVAWSRLVAAREVLNAFFDLMRKRQIVQATRRRTDAQVFPLFRWALVSNFDDDQFIRAMQHAISRFGLDHLFDSGAESASFKADIDAGTYERSQEVSLLLLRALDHALAISDVSEEPFHLGGAPPDQTLRVPLDSIAALAEMNHWLWSLPQATLGEVLDYLAEACQGLATSIRPKYGKSIVAA